jgi:SAM-dependent methyltransferase
VYRSPENYDLIYLSFKDYEDEAGKIADLLRATHPGARTILDVACGTGEHARHLSSQHGFTVDGIDLDPGFIEIAAGKNPRGNFRQANMTGFDLGRTYDIVLCLFSSIGYVVTREKLVRALASFRRHIADDGIVLVEPWFPPDVLTVGKIFTTTAERGDRSICRMALVETIGKVSRTHSHYLIGGRAGIIHESEVHELGLFTIDEMKAAFREAGLTVEHDPEGPAKRGLYVGRRAT